MTPAICTPPFQIGTLARDAQAARDRHEHNFGVCPWVGSGWRWAQFWDGASNEVLELRYRAMFGRLTDDLGLEFIEVDPATPRSGAAACVPRSVPESTTCWPARPASCSPDHLSRKRGP